MTKTQRFNLGFAALVAAVTALAGTHAQAQGQTCGPRDVVVDRLANQFGETRRGLGLGSRNRVVEVFAADASGTWTITVTLPDGRTCLVASGDNWEDRADDLSHLQDADA
ncbi:hypothetical protein [Jannaschia sp. LMIT008]|uniref:hypothetical protein n=1 Tax=Jannaschia maritima TaxID=3032585 RepID=UPI002812521D|nr:hypothetical protein [Jannaschia sp. LMIT008]